MDNPRQKNDYPPHMKTAARRVMDALEETQMLLPQYQQSYQKIAGKIPGWSKLHHYHFFSAVFGGCPEIKRVLILGVYMGRDIATMLACSTQSLSVIGVDKFSDTPCDDWPESKKGGNWEQAGFGAYPQRELAQQNIEEFKKLGDYVELVASDDAQWLANSFDKFDLIYLDTSHDKATVVRQLMQVRPLCHESTLLAGDDYENIVETWGVKDAVTEGFNEHHVLADCIWWADAKELK